MQQFISVKMHFCCGEKHVSVLFQQHVNRSGVQQGCQSVPEEMNININRSRQTRDEHANGTYRRRSTPTVFKDVITGSNRVLAQQYHSVRVCVCVCVCGHVYVVYEDTNVYNDMGIT